MVCRGPESMQTLRSMESALQRYRLGSSVTKDPRPEAELDVVGRLHLSRSDFQRTGKLLYFPLQGLVNAVRGLKGYGCALCPRQLEIEQPGPADSARALKSGSPKPQAGMQVGRYVFTD